MYTPIVNKRKNNRWIVYSPKIRRELCLQGLLAYDHWVLVETDSSVQTFCEYPLKIYKIMYGKRESSIFDMWIKTRVGDEVMVKLEASYKIEPSDKKRDERCISQIRNMTEWCKDNGKEFVVRTEIDIRSNPIYLLNMKSIIPFLRHTKLPIETDRQHILRLLKYGPTTLAAIFANLSFLPSYRIMGAFSWLHVGGLIKTNLNSKLLGDDTEVSLYGIQEKI
jgi:hypothetical protein